MTVWPVIRAMVRTNLLELVRDRKAVMITLLMPLILTAILGFALGSVFQGNSIPKFPVVVANLDSGVQGRVLARVLESINKQLDVQEVTSRRKANNALSDGLADVAVIIPKNYSDLIATNQPASVSVEASVNNFTKSAIVKAIINGYGQQAGIGRYVATQGAIQGRPLQMPNASVSILSPGLHPITSLSYYAVGMIAMFMLTTAMSRATALALERKGDRFKRLLISPCPRLALSAGYFSSMAIVLFVQSIFIAVGDSVILGITLGPWIQVITLLICYSIALSGLSMALGTWINSHEILSGLTNIGVQVASILGGSIYPLYFFPKVMQWVGHALPNGQVLSGLLGTVTGITMSGLMIPITYLLCLGIFGGILASLHRWRPAS